MLHITSFAGIALWGCIIWLLIFEPIKSCREEKIERQNKEREEHIKDSIRNTQQYKDSVAREKEFIRLSLLKADSIENESLFVLLCDSDSTYHSYLECSDFVEFKYNAIAIYYEALPLTNFKLASKSFAIEHGYKQCHLCDEMVHVDDAWDWVKDNVDINDIKEYIEEQDY